MHGPTTISSTKIEPIKNIDNNKQKITLIIIFNLGYQSLIISWLHLPFSVIHS